MLTLNISTKAEDTIKFLFPFFLFFFFFRGVNAGNRLLRCGKHLHRAEGLLCRHSVAQSCPTFCNLRDSVMSGFPVVCRLLEFAQTHVHRLGDTIKPSHPLSSPSPPGLYLSQHQGLFRWVSSSHQVAKYWSFSFSRSPSNEYSGLISFRMDWFDLLAVQGTLKSLLQHHSSKASILQPSAFFMVQLSHQYMSNGKAVELTICTFISKVMSLIFNMLSRFITAFLLRSKCLLILWLQLLSTVLLEPRI